MAPRPDVTRDLSPPARAGLEAVGRLTGAAFRLSSRVRGTKVLHPRGVVHEASVTISAGTGAPTAAPLLSRPGRFDAVVRFSRATGLPKALPDVLGLAIRLLDAHGRDRHQDFLLVTAGNGAVLQHVLLPARTLASLPYSSLLPYRVGGRLWLVGARAHGDACGTLADADGDELDGLLPLAASDRPAFELCVAPLGGRFTAVGELALGERLDDSANRIRFNPFNTGGGLEPATVLSRLRAYAYPASQQGWEDASPESLAA